MSSRNSTSGSTSGIIFFLFLFLSSADAAFAVNCQWTGMGPDNRWSTAANWTLCQGRAPINGDDLRFLAATPRPANVNDIPSLEIRNFVIDEQAAGDGPYDISGEPLLVRGTIRVQPPAAPPGAGTFLRLPIVMNGLNAPPEIVVANPGMTVSITGAITGGNTVPLRLRVSGRGTLVLSNTANDWFDVTVVDATVRLGAAGALPVRNIHLHGTATLDLNDLNATIGRLIGEVNASARIQLGTGTLTIEQDQAAVFVGTISGSGGLVKNGVGRLVLRRSLFAPGPNTYTGTTTVNAGFLELDHDDNTVCIQGPLVINGGVVTLRGDHEIADTAPVTVNAPGRLSSTGFRDTIGSLSGTGDVNLGIGTGVLSIGGDNSSTTFTGKFAAFPATPGIELLQKVGTGTLTLTGDSMIPGILAVRGGRLAVDGRLSLTGVVVDGGTLNGTGTLINTTGTGTLNTVTLTSGAIAPGHPVSGMGILHADEVLATGGLVSIVLRGTTSGAGYSQLDLTTFFRLSPATRLSVSRGVFAVPRGAAFTIIDLAGNRLGEGTFQDLPEGGTLMVEGQQFAITYRGGDGNDVVLTAVGEPPAITYFLSEGATGGFFDEDIAIANPHDKPAPVTLTFSKENGEQVVATRTVPAMARLTVDVESIPGLEATSASAQVRSDAGLQLVVERSMFWQDAHYAGHTGGAVAQPSEEWFFAEGSQGFFKTFVLVINPHATPTDVTFTFFRENEPAVMKTVTLGASARLTLSAGDVPELVDRSFGIAVRGTQPIMAERSMYFGTTPTRFWSGGHASAGVTAAANEWFLSEGATGGFFDTFILLSNPQTTPAQVTLRYLLDSGETVNVEKTIAANARLTTNIETEADPRLHNAAVSTVVTSDVPIIAERSMYWPGAARPWGEAHNSFGVVRANTSWGLAEGRVGGPLRFQSYILLANPRTEAAQVTVTFLVERSSSAPIVQTYTVPPTSRFNIDAAAVPGLTDASFGAVITVTNGVPIIVERSMYWDVDGILFSGGTNATAIALGDVPP